MGSLARVSVKRILVIAAVVNLATNMVHPVTPTLIEQRGYADSMFGILFAAMAVGSLLCAPLWGRISDKCGRVRPFAAATMGYLLAQVGFCYCQNPVLAVAVRFVGGCFAVGVTVLQMAYMVDISDESVRAKNLSYLAAAVTLGSCLGYFLGGIAGIWSVEAAFWTQSGVLLACAAAMLLFLGESRENRQTLPGGQVCPEGQTLPGGQALSAERNPAQGKGRGGFAAARRLLTPGMVLLLLGVAAAIFSTTGYENALNYYFRDQMRFDSWVNGVLKGVAGCVGLGLNLWLNPRIARRFSNHRALCASLMGCAGAVCAMILMRSLPMFLAMKILCDGFIALFQPMQQAAAAESQKRDFGLLSGLFASARSVGMVSGSLAAGFLYEVSPALPFCVQAGTFALAALCALLSAPRKSVSRA